MILFDSLNITHIFLDTAPLIYYVEENPSYFPIVKTIFDYIDNGSLALSAGCEAFLTNDITLRRVTELNVLILDEMGNL